MERERVIWRPNSISPAEWESKSREEQIAYWKDLTNKQPAPKRKMVDVLARYANGTISASNFFSWICERASHEEMPEFTLACPDEIAKQICDHLSSYPGDDPKKWPRTFYMASYAPWCTAEEIQRSREEEQRRIWDGVRILKSHFLE